MEAVVAVAGTDGSSSDIANSLADRAPKSLIAADVGAGDVRFRLLDTTRAYARAKLEETGETETLAARYATYYQDFLEVRRQFGWGSSCRCVRARNRQYSRRAHLGIRARR